MTSMLPRRAAAGGEGGGWGISRQAREAHAGGASLAAAAAAAPCCCYSCGSPRLRRSWQQQLARRCDHLQKPNFSVPKPQPTTNTATGMSACSRGGVWARGRVRAGVSEASNCEQRASGSSDYGYQILPLPTHLEHLDEGDGEVHIRGVAQPEGAGIQESDGHNRAHVYSRRGGVEKAAPASATDSTR